MAKMTVAYWDFRGLAEPIRYVLHYKNIKFVDKRYQADGSWENEKFSLGLDFPNLPYYFEGNLKLSQSTTILRYLAKKYNLEGETEDEKLRASLAEQQLLDFRMKFISLCYNEEFEKKKDDYLKQLPDELKLLEKFLGGKKFLVGDSVTYVDFIAHDVLDYQLYLSKTILDGFPTLKSYLERVKNLPGLRDYMKSSAYVKWPIVGPSATFGGKGDEPK